MCLCVATTPECLVLSVMGNKLKIATDNCQGIKISEPCIKAQLGQVDILPLKETWLCGDELHRPNTHNMDFVSFSTIAVDDTQDLRRRSPYNGLTFLCHKSLSKHIRVSPEHYLEE